ncbi:MAG: thioredoxin [Lysobacteraceae bacterium]|nr:MAG: thioredoxin [Xanthomonadaceae bacterium]
MSAPYETAQPERAAVDAMPGTVMLDFGANWCGYCRAAEPLIDEALAGSNDASKAGNNAVRHLKVEDGPGRPLGRSFRIKLWPTVVVLKDGKEVARVVRPVSADEVRVALAQAGAA